MNVVIKGLQSILGTEIKKKIKSEDKIFVYYQYVSFAYLDTEVMVCNAVFEIESCILTVLNVG